MTNLYATDFPWCREPLFVQSVTLRGKRPNLLVNCAPSELYQVKGELMRWCAAPVVLCEMPGWLDFPVDEEATLLVTRIEEMSLDQQIALFDWMTLAPARVQVISVATTRLDPLVRDGRFLEGLYYRLNMVQVDARYSAMSGARHHIPAPPIAYRRLAF